MSARVRGPTIEARVELTFGGCGAQQDFESSAVGGDTHGTRTRGDANREGRDLEHRSKFDGDASLSSTSFTAAEAPRPAHELVPLASLRPHAARPGGRVRLDGSSRA